MLCGELTFAKEKRSITSHIKKLYKAYFHCDIRDQEKTHVCCLTCVKTLSAWYANKNVHMKFGVPMIWRKQKDHFNDCYFCQQDYTGCTTAKKKATLFTQTCSQKCAHLCFCNDIAELFEQLEIPYDSTNGRRFLDAFKKSIKSVLLHNGNTLQSVPIAYSATMKESYENLKTILTRIQFNVHKWHVCADFKVIAMLTGLQPGYTKFCCFLCLWDSRARTEQYVRKHWPARDEIKQGRHNIKQKPLLQSDIYHLCILKLVCSSNL